MNSYGDGNTYRGTVCKDSEVPTIITDGKTPYSGKDYPVHSNAPWRIEGVNVKTAISSGCKHVAMVNYFDCGKGDPRSIMKEEHEANAKLIAAAPEMLEVLRWLDNEMDCRDDEFGGCLFSRGDFEKVRMAIKLAMEGYFQDAKWNTGNAPRNNEGIMGGDTMTAQEWLEIYDKEKPYGCSAEIAASIIRDQQDELTCLRAELAEKDAEIERGKTYKKAHSEECKMMFAEIGAKLQAAESLAASRLADQEAIERHTRKRVARECAEIAEAMWSDHYWAWPAMQICADKIRKKYGVSNEK